MRPKYRMAIGSFGLLIIILAAKPAACEDPRKVRIFAGLPPVGWLAEEVGGEMVEVQVLLGPGQSPHTYEPTPRQMADLNRADLYFSVGFPFEERILAKAVMERGQTKIIRIDEGLARRKLDGSAEEDDEHGGNGTDPHLWLSPPNLKAMAGKIADNLMRLDPDRRGLYEANLDRLSLRLDSLHVRLGQILAPFKGQSFYVFHPAFGYFADAYGLKQIPVEIEGKSPTPRQIEQLIKRARMEGVRIIFIQPQFDRKSAEAIARAIGGSVVSIDPLANDILAGLEEIAMQISGALK